MITEVYTKLITTHGWEYHGIAISDRGEEIKFVFDSISEQFISIDDDNMKEEIKERICKEREFVYDSQ